MKTYKVEVVRVLREYRTVKFQSSYSETAQARPAAIGAALRDCDEVWQQGDCDYEVISDMKEVLTPLAALKAITATCSASRDVLKAQQAPCLWTPKDDEALEAGFDAIELAEKGDIDLTLCCVDEEDDTCS